MKGVPKWLNSKDDVLFCVQLALEGELDKNATKKKLQDLLSDEKVYVYKSTVGESYMPAENEKVCEARKEDGSIEYHCYELQQNPNARYVQMGLSKEEIQDLLAQLEV